MDLGLRNKVAVVLAGSAGIGRGIAETLAQEGCHVAICGRNADTLQKAAAEIAESTNVDVLALTADVSKKESLDLFFDSVFEKYGHVDILINNSGGPRPGKCLELSDEEYEEAFNLVFMSKVRATKRVVPSMITRGWGRVINIESTSVKMAMGNMILSNAMRNASTSFANTLSLETAKDGIRIHTLMSGPFLTDRVRVLGDSAANEQGISFDEWTAAAEKNTPLGRFGDPIEFGSIVAFLSSDHASYLSGTSIAVDGGVLAAIN